MVQLQIRGVDIDFPFPPYDCQVSYMEKVIHCLQEVSQNSYVRLIAKLERGANIRANDLSACGDAF